MGSLASQAVGKVMGVVDHISWKQAAVAGLGSYIGAGLTDLVAGASSTVGSALAEAGKAGASWQSIAIAYGAQGVAGYTGNYIASKAVGLDTSFSWKNMAASAIGSIVGGSVNRGSGFWNSTIRGQISAHSSAWMRDKWFGGDRPDYGQVAADAFGNVLVDYIVGELNAQAEDKNQAQDKPGRWIGEPAVDEGGKPFYSTYDSEGYFKDKVLLASNGDAVPIARSDVVEVVDPGAVAEYREAGWFDLASSLTDEEFAGLKYIGSLDKELPVWLSYAFQDLKESRAASYANWTNKINEAEGPFSASSAFNLKVMKEMLYEAGEVGLSLMYLGYSPLAREEAYNRVSYKVTHPIETFRSGVDSAGRFLSETPAAQAMEDTYSFGLSTVLTLGVGKIGLSVMRGAMDTTSLLARKLAYRRELGSSETLVSGVGEVDLLQKQTPLGFATESEFDMFGESLHRGLAEAGFQNVDAVFQGSAVTGKAYKPPHHEFDVGRLSDYDVALSSPELFQRAQDVGAELRSKGTRTAPLTRSQIKRLGLYEMQRQLSDQAGRPVRFMIYQSVDDAINRSPSISVPRNSR